MPTRVVDASALAALAFGEPQAEKMSEALSDCVLVAPLLLWFEMAAVCVKKIRNHPDLARQIRAAFGLALRLPVTISDVDHESVVDLAGSSALETRPAGTARGIHRSRIQVEDRRHR